MMNGEPVEQGCCIRSATAASSRRITASPSSPNVVSLGIDDDGGCVSTPIR